MRHPFRIKEIASRAGLSEATVDRAIHNRGGVKAATVAAVEQAISDLRHQHLNSSISGRSLLVDVVIHASPRVTAAVKRVLEEQMPSLRPSDFRFRFHLQDDHHDPAVAVRALGRIMRRGSDGVIVQVPFSAAAGAATARLTSLGIPLVAMSEDRVASSDSARVGVDQEASGATAAHLFDRWLGGDPGRILICAPSDHSRISAQRELGFRLTMRSAQPNRPVVTVNRMGGSDDDWQEQVFVALTAHPDIAAVYSVGDGNTAIVNAFAAAQLACRAFIAHDVDGENRQLLLGRQMSAVIHHDLGLDLLRACQIILLANSSLPWQHLSGPSPVQIITPFNLPAARF